MMIASDTLRIVVGLGATGLSCVRYLHAKGERFLVVDSRENPPGLEALKRDYPEVAIGTFDSETLCNASELIVSPGLSLALPEITAAKAAGVKISGDIDLFVAEAKGRIAAVTGSNGKSTVVSLLGEMAKQAGVKVAVGGNLGTPALDLLDDNVELYILELSSFQLERCQQINADVATVLNVSEDHLDHHGSMVAYHQAKHRIYFGCKQAVVNADDPLSKPLVPDSVRQWTFSLGEPDFRGFGVLSDEKALGYGYQSWLPLSELNISGQHNVANALAALALGSALDFDRDAMLNVLRQWPGLRHRCQYVASRSGVDYYNDSKATNTGAALASLTGLASEGRKLVLIAGGQHKGGDLTPLIDSLVEHGRAGVFIGESTQEFERILNKRLPSSAANDMPSAVASAAEFAQRGDVVLLAPACASFDMFANYQHRGDAFIDAVEALDAGALA